MFPILVGDVGISSRSRTIRGSLRSQLQDDTIMKVVQITPQELEQQERVAQRTDEQIDDVAMVEEIMKAVQFVQEPVQKSMTKQIVDVSVRQSRDKKDSRADHTTLEQQECVSERILEQISVPAQREIGKAVHIIPQDSVQHCTRKQNVNVTVDRLLNSLHKGGSERTFF